MYKKIFIILSLILSFNTYAQTVIVLPDNLILSSINPTQYFPSDIQNYFSITAEAKSAACAKKQNYILSLLIYRNAVDNKMVASYRPANDADTCWIDLLSYSNQLIPDMSAGGWQPASTPNTNIWCVQQPSSCPILDNANKLYYL